MPRSSGKCGTGVTIHYRDELGEVGDFLGNVAAPNVI
jgi:hypothetical protein